MKPFNYNRILLISGIIFTLHNIEEAFGMAHFVMPSFVSLPIKLPAVVPMIWSIILITIIGWGLIIWVIQQPNEMKKRNLLTFLLFLFVINAIIPHIAASVALQSYTPAVVTSILLYIPFSLWGLPKLYRQFDVRKQLYAVLYVGTIATLIIIVALHRITTLIFS